MSETVEINSEFAVGRRRHPGEGQPVAEHDAVRTTRVAQISVVPRQMGSIVSCPREPKADKRGDELLVSAAGLSWMKSRDTITGAALHPTPAKILDVLRRQRFAANSSPDRKPVPFDVNRTVRV